MRDMELAAGDARYLRAQRPASATAYDAFISYSHAVDGKLAPVFQRELERFAKPWYRVRSARVFRDKASLTASPGLWSSIEDALSRSKWFILMASPESANSAWVDREVRWWLEHAADPARHLLIAVTAGDLAWDEQEGDFAPSASPVLPPALCGAFTEEPRWVDLRWLRGADQLDRSDPRLRDCVADVAAAVRGTDKDLVIGEHIRQHRRALRLARGGVTALATFLVLAVVAGLIAVGQRNTAVANLRTATAGQLAALAVADLNTHIDLAQLFAVAAYRMKPDPQTLSALFQAVVASPHLERYLPLPAGSQVTVLAGSANGRIVAAGTDDGRLLRWDTERGTLTWARAGAQEITAIAIDASGDRIVAAGAAKTYLWNATTADQPRAIYSGSAQSVAISPSGRTVAVLGGTSTNGGSEPVVDFSGAAGAEIHRTVADQPYDYVGLPNDATLQLDSGEADWARLSAATLSVIAAGSEPGATPGDLHYCCGYSTSGRYLLWAKYGWADVVDTNLPPSVDQGGDNPSHLTTEPILAPDQFAVSNDGSEMALAGGGDLSVDLSATAQPNYDLSVRFDPVQDLPGTGRISALAFLGGSDQELVSANGSALALWDGTQVSRITTGPVVDDGVNCGNSGFPPKIGISPDGTRIATVSDGDLQTVIENTAPPYTSVSATDSIGAALPLWSADDKRLFLLGDDGHGHGGLVWSNGSFRSAWPGPSTRDEDWGGVQEPGEVVAAQLAADGRVILVNEHGDVQIRQGSNGAILRTIPGIAQQIIPPTGGESENRAAISADSAAVAFVLPDGTVRVTSVASGQHRDLPGPPAFVVTYAAGRLLVQRTDGTLEEWDQAGTRLIRSIPGDAAYAEAITGIPHSDLVARLTYQGSIELTDLDSGQTLGALAAPPPGHSGGEPPWDATTIAASPDGKELVTASTCGSVIRWQLDPKAWIRSACTLAGHDLTADEWRLYVGTTPPANLACMGLGAVAKAERSPLAF